MTTWTDTANEKTSVLDRFEDIAACALDILADIRNSHDLCLDKWGPSAVLGNKLVRDAFLAVHNRGAKIRLITEISNANAGYCKEFMKFAEVRHLDVVKGNFSVSDVRWYTASTVTEKDAPPGRLIFSTVKEIVEQHQHLFETLWNDALPAEQKLGQLGDGREPEKTQILSGEPATTDAIIDFISKAENGWCDCGDKYMPSIAIQVPQINQAIRNAKQNGLVLKYITDITEENVQSCKALRELVELRHLGGVKANFAVSDTHYMVATILTGENYVPQVIYSNVATLVAQQRYTFDALWNNAIPAEDRIRQIEKGIEPEKTAVIQNSDTALRLFLEMIMQSRKELLFILPTADSLRRLIRSTDLVGQIFKAAEERNVDAMILIPSNNPTLQALLLDRGMQVSEAVRKNISIRGLEAISEINSIILVADRNRSLVMGIEENPVERESLFGAVSVAVYTNSKAAVISYASIFESLWRQSELYQHVRDVNTQLEAANEQLKVHDKMHTEFVNIAAHELRTPIQPILAIADMLRDGLEGRKEIVITDQEIAILDRNANRLQKLSSEILDATRIESGTLKLELVQIDMNEKVKNAIADVKSLVQTTNVQICFEPYVDHTREDVPPLPVMIDRLRMFEVIANLLRNAIKYSDDKKEGSTKTILVSTSKTIDGKQILVSIRDEGTGIDPNMLPRLFTKFSTDRERGGTGLGLFIAKNIVEAHGGKIWAENNADGKGATFSFSIPLLNTS